MFYLTGYRHNVGSNASPSFRMLDTALGREPIDLSDQYDVNLLQRTPEPVFTMA